MLQQFLHDFGYFALFLGTFFEGETILVLAGFLAFRGYMDINLVVVVAFFGSYAGDQLWYYMGRKHGRKLLARKPRWQLMGDKALEHIRKHPDIWVLSFRFVYGLRTVMPVAIGLSGYPPLRYLVLNGIGAAIWAAALGAAAYHFGAVLEGMLGSVKKYELWVLGALLVLGGCLWLRRRFKTRAWPNRPRWKKKTKPPTPTPRPSSNTACAPALAPPEALPMTAPAFSLLN